MRAHGAYGEYYMCWVHNEHMEFYTDSLIISAKPLVINCRTSYEYIKHWHKLDFKQFYI